MKLFSAKYFDGHTAKAHDINIEVADGNTFRFVHQERVVVWNFKELLFEKNSTSLTVFKKNNLAENIRFEDTNTANEIYQIAKTCSHTSWYQNMTDIGIQFYLSAAAFIICIIVCLYLFVIPWIGEKAVNVIPISFDEKIGNTAFEQLEPFTKFDEEKSKKLTTFASYIDFDTDRALTFKVAKDNQINAFALPNGTIVVYTGLLDKINNYEELAALLGHEVTHVKNRHTTKILARSLAGYIAISVIIGDASGIMSTLASNANELNNLSFSRAFEKESDVGSYEILKLNHINPKGMYELFTTLSKNEKIAIPKMLSTHPLTQDRMTFSKGLMDKKEISIREHPEMQKSFEELKK